MDQLFNLSGTFESVVIATLQATQFISKSIARTFVMIISVMDTAPLEIIGDSQSS
jgi:hypothetical protein